MDFKKQILDSLEAASPTKAELTVADIALPVKVYVWRMDFAGLRDIVAIAVDCPDDDEVSIVERSIRLVAHCVGVEQPGDVFNDDAGIDWMRRNPRFVIEAANRVREFNELDGPSEDRQKKSDDTPGSTTSADPSASPAPAS